MAGLPKELADEIGKSPDAGGSGVYYEHGDYPLVYIKSWYYKGPPVSQSRIIVLETVPIIAKAKQVKEKEKSYTSTPNPVGSTVSTVFNFDATYHKEAKRIELSKSRMPVKALYGDSGKNVADSVISQRLSEITDEKAPMVGMVMALSTAPHEKGDGGFLVNLNWEHVAAPGAGMNAPDKVAARRAAYATSPEQMVKVALEQYGASSNGASTTSATSTETKTATPPAVDGPPEIPGDAPPELPAVKDPLEGWKPHPKDAAYVWKGKVVAKKEDVIAGKHANA